jgi:hypothetical protein
LCCSTRPEYAAARIEVEDIDSKRKVIHIRQGTGIARGTAQLLAVEKAARIPSTTLSVDRIRTLILESAQDALLW